MARKQRLIKKKRREVSLKTTNFGEDTENQMSDSDATVAETDSEQNEPSSTKRPRHSGTEEVVDTKKEKLKERNSNEFEEYEVENIVEDRLVRGKIQYRIHWKGFSSSQDTWENEEDLDCDELLNAYLKKKQKTSANDEEVYSEEEQTSKIANNSKEKTGKKRAHIKKKRAVVKKSKVEIKPDENGEYVVSRIIDMHVSKNGKHEYLVNWKGFPLSQSSWEPEENVKDTAAFERFLKRLEEAKSASYKELRVSRRPTDRFTMSPQANDRRLSRRFQNKQRPHYFEAE